MCQLLTDRHVMVFSIPGMRCIPSLIRLPILARLSASAIPIMLKGRVNVSTDVIIFKLSRACATSVVLPTVVSIRMNTRVPKCFLHRSIGQSYSDIDASVKAEAHLLCRVNARSKRNLVHRWDGFDYIGTSSFPTAADG